MKQLVISVDFDGTIVSSVYPEIGTPKPMAVQTLRKWHSAGHKIIISTCRSGIFADNARMKCIELGIPFDAFNENLQSRISYYGGDCRKISADVYIDDRSPEAILDRGINWLRLDRQIAMIARGKVIRM
jgi:hypothetical protein